MSSDQKAIVPRVIAYYLPQFYPTPENDEWWGKGFTEWTNVGKAKQLFKGHYQPHVPADLGYYDLRLSEAREAQANLVKEHGIHGFRYYHYWFNGRRILERPFQEVFESKKPDFSFMLCWANKNWTRIWDGGENHKLLEQKYSEEDDLNHVKSLLPYFKDPRYIRVDGKPVFCIYRSSLLPNPEKTVQIWRNEAKKEGLELYLCRFEHNGFVGKKFLNGFDASVEFAPFGNSMKDYFVHKKNTKGIISRALNRMKYLIAKKLKSNSGLMAHLYNWVDYEDFVEFAMSQEADVDYKRFPGITPPGITRREKRKTSF